MSRFTEKEFNYIAASKIEANDFLSIKEVAAKWGEKVNCMYYNYSGNWVNVEMIVNQNFLRDMHQGSIKECKEAKAD